MVRKITAELWDVFRSLDFSSAHAEIDVHMSVQRERNRERNTGGYESFEYPGRRQSQETGCQNRFLHKSTYFFTKFYESFLLQDTA